MNQFLVFPSKSFFSEQKKYTFGIRIIKNKPVFLIGILSSPLPYMLAAFCYLLAISFGVFSKIEADTGDDKLHSNIINYEELIPNQENISKNADYLAYYSNEFCEELSPDIPANFFAISNCTIDYSPPGYTKPYYDHLVSLSNSNRPPPVFA